MRDINNKTAVSTTNQFNQLIQLEKKLIHIVIKLISEDADLKITDKESASVFIDTLKKYYIAINSASILIQLRQNSIERVLKFLLVYPIKLGADVRKVVRLLNKYWLMDMVSFFYFQITSKRLSKKRIGDFLSYIGSLEGKAIFIFYLYRVNPEFVGNNYNVQLDGLTPREIYYGISSGYYELLSGTNEAVMRLLSLNAQKELSMLKADGLWIID